MSCNAVLITQFNFPDNEVPNTISAQIAFHVDDALTEVRRIEMKSLYQIAVLHANASCVLRVLIRVYSLDLNRLLSKLPLTADVGGRYFSSSAVFSHDMSPRTWLRSVIPHSLMAVSNSSFNTTPSLGHTHTHIE